METLNILCGILSQESFMVVNLPLAKAIGLNEAVMYSSLLSKCRYYTLNGTTIEENGREYFYSTVEDLEESTSLSRKQQDNAINNLVSMGLIDKKLMGMPARRYFHVVQDDSALEKIRDIMQGGKHVSTKGANKIVPKGQTRLSQKGKQDCPKGANKIVPKGQQKVLNKSINNNINNNINKKEKEAPAVPSVPPPAKWTEKKAVEDFTQRSDVREAFMAFLESRKKMRVPNTERAVNLIMNKLAPHPPDIQIAMLNKSIISGWRGVFDLKKQDLEEMGYRRESNVPQFDVAARAIAMMEEREYEQENGYYQGSG